MEKNSNKLATANVSSEEFIQPPYQIESSALIFARQELQMLCKLYPTKENPPTVKDFIHEILALVDKFGHSGQSGGSAPYVAHTIATTIEKLLTFKSLLPIYGTDDEWVDISELCGRLPDNKMKYQNKRLSSVFMDSNGKSWFLDAIVWKTPKGGTYSSSGVKLADGRIITSKQYIKSFPFEPKTFYIDVNETETSPDDWEFSVKDEDQLKLVFEYYDFFS